MTLTHQGSAAAVLWNVFFPIGHALECRLEIVIKDRKGNVIFSGL